MLTDDCCSVSAAGVFVSPLFTVMCGLSLCRVMLQAHGLQLGLTLFPYCWTWLVFVWLFTILNCFNRVSFCRSSWRNKSETTHISSHTEREVTLPFRNFPNTPHDMNCFFFCLLIEFRDRACAVYAKYPLSAGNVHHFLFLPLFIFNSSCFGAANEPFMDIT